MATTIDDLCRFMESFAPPTLAEQWDNVGLLIGRSDRPAARVMTCLTITPTTAQEAVERRADLIVAHHPMPFRPTNRITNDTTVGGILLELIENQVAVYSPHTAFDSARLGINQQLAEALDLTCIQPLKPHSEEEQRLGGGRYGECREAVSLKQLSDRVKEFLSVDRVRLVGEGGQPVGRVAVACGAAGEFLPVAQQLGCQLLVTGETNFHTCLEAEASGTALLLTGHYASERFALETLATTLAGEFRDAEIWASRTEANPWHWA